jgi:N,N'-diacetyllegionaminate synthase
MLIEIKIGGKSINEENLPFIIAEAGLNHNGDLEKALEMISIAKNAGVDAVKFQTFKAHEIVEDTKLTYSYKSQGKEITESMYEMFKRCEFSKKEWHEIKRKCDDEKIIFLSTPQNRSDLDLLLEIGISAIKVGSDDFTSLPLLKSFASTKLPLILSCGMSNLGEVYNALESVGALDGYPTILLLTTSQYPTPIEEVNLQKIITLSNSFPKIPIGFSDHTIGNVAASMAVCLGACVFEKHFTLDHNLPGPDHWFAADSQQLKEYVITIKNAKKILGSGIVRATNSEEKMKISARRSVTSLSDIKKFETLSNENLGMRRPGDGISTAYLDEIIGKKALKEIKKGSKIKFGDFG